MITIIGTLMLIIVMILVLITIMYLIMLMMLNTLIHSTIKRSTYCLFKALTITDLVNSGLVMH
jgi:hypothetical protein